MSQARISIHVKPGATATQVVGWREEVLEIRIAAPPQKGRANAALRQFLSEVLGIAPGRLSIVRGQGSRHKILAIEGLEQEEVWRKLGR